MFRDVPLHVFVLNIHGHFNHLRYNDCKFERTFFGGVLRTYCPAPKSKNICSY